MMKKIVPYLTWAVLAFVPMTLATSCDSDDNDADDVAATTVMATSVEVEVELSDDILKYCDVQLTYSDTQGEHTLTNPRGEACTLEYKGVEYPGAEYDITKYGDHTGVTTEVSFVFKAKEGVTSTDDVNFLVKRTVDGKLIYANGSDKDLKEYQMEKSSLGIKPEGLATAIKTLNTILGNTKATVSGAGVVTVE